MTVRHLLNHTSGLPDYEELFQAKGLVDRDWPRSIKSRPSAFEPTAKDALALLAQQTQLLFEPGDKWEYSNSGYVVLGQIIEKVSGTSYAKFLAKYIFQPLGMDRSIVYDESRPKIANQALSYTKQAGGYKEINYTPLNLIYGEDNVYTTLDDLCKWTNALQTEKLVKYSSLNEAFRPAILNNGTKTDYGFGWFVGKTLGLPHIAHTGNWLGFNTIIKSFPEERFTVVILSNCDDFPLTDAAYMISKVYLGERMSMPTPIKLNPDILRKYAGIFKLESGKTWDVSMEEGELWVKNFRPAKMRLIPIDKQTFFLEGREDLTAVFEKNSESQISGLKLGSYPWARKLP